MSIKGNRERGADVGRVSFVDMGVPELLGNGNAAVFAVVFRNPVAFGSARKGKEGAFPLSPWPKTLSKFTAAAFLPSGTPSEASRGRAACPSRAWTSPAYPLMAMPQFFPATYFSAPRLHLRKLSAGMRKSISSCKTIRTPV